jgi:hypothetical protein
MWYVAIQPNSIYISFHQYTLITAECNETSHKTMLIRWWLRGAFPHLLASFKKEIKKEKREGLEAKCVLLLS